MALQLAYAAPTGDNYAAAYLRIRRWDIDFVNRDAVVVAELFRNDAARQAERKPVETFSRVMGASVVTAILTGPQADPRPGIYAWLKSLPEFAEATDV
jgi:hypothetical protein